jgi:hypothetical protein
MCHTKQFGGTRLRLLERTQKSIWDRFGRPLYDLGPLWATTLRSGTALGNNSIAASLESYVPRGLGRFQKCMASIVLVDSVPGPNFGLIVAFTTGWASGAVRGPEPLFSGQPVGGGLLHFSAVFEAFSGRSVLSASGAALAPGLLASRASSGV